MSGNVTCVQNPPETWWLNSQGENPCQSYQRLIKVCDAGYTMQNTPSPPFYATCPGNKCCCTSIAYSLMSACWSCQWGPQAPPSNPGTFDTFMSGKCSTWSNGTLSDELEQSMRPSVPAPWAYVPVTQHGVWSYLAAQQNASAVSTSTASVASVSSISVASVSSISLTSAAATSTLSTSRPTSTTPVGIGGDTEGGTSGRDSPNSTPVGAIVGGVVGGLVLIALLVGLVWLRRRKRQKALTGGPPTSYNQNPLTSPHMQGVQFQSTPFIYPTHLLASSNTPSTSYPPTQFSPGSSADPASAFRSTTTKDRSSRQSLRGGSSTSLPVIQQEIDAGAISNPAEPSVVRLPPSYDPRWSQPNIRK